MTKNALWNAVQNTRTEIKKARYANQVELQNRSRGKERLTYLEYQDLMKTIRGLCDKRTELLLRYTRVVAKEAELIAIFSALEETPREALMSFARSLE